MLNIRLVSFPGMKPIGQFSTRETTLNKSFWLDGAYISY